MLLRCIQSLFAFVTILISIRLLSNNYINDNNNTDLKYYYVLYLHFILYIQLSIFSICKIHLIIYTVGIISHERQL